MVLKYETMTEDERRTDRLDRYRWREGWERNTLERRFCYTAATMVAQVLEDQEDSVLKVAAADFAGKDAALQGMRRSAMDLQKLYLQLETGNKYGFNIAEKFFDRKSAVQGLTEEQEKLLKAIIKEEGGEASGSKSKKAKQDNGKEEPKAGGSGSGAGASWGDGAQAGGSGGGAGPGWGFAPPFPYAQPNMGSFAAGYPGMMMGGWPAPPNQAFGGGGYGGGAQYGMVGQQSYPQQGGGYGQGGAGGSGYGQGGAGGGNQGGAGTSGRGAANNKRRYPCDNCGSMEHWKYEVVCPKYHLHLEQLAAKHAGARGQQGGAAGGQQGAHLALPPPPPGRSFDFKELFK
jgi:hypothetical protein